MIAFVMSDVRKIFLRKVNPAFFRRARGLFLPWASV
jgi:hypothetical protein